MATPPARVLRRPLAARGRFWRHGHVFLKLMLIFVYFFLYAPVLLLALTSFHPGEVITFPMPGYSTRWYRVFFSDEEMLTSLANSLIVAVAAAVIAGVIGTFCALGLVRSEFRGKRLANLLVLAPLIVPPVITGIALVMFLHVLGLSRGFAYLIIGHVLLGLPYVVLVVSAQLYGFPRDLEQAALSLGANEVETFFEVTLPLLMPSILAGMMFAFITSLQEYPATQAWASPSSYTLPVIIFNKIRDRLTPEINVVGVFMVLVAATLPLLGEYLRTRKSVTRS